MIGSGPELSGVCGAVLTGGASRRMGEDKALVEVAGRPMAARVVAALRDAGCTTVVAIGGDPRRGDALGAELLPDLWPGEGPLGGILTAIEWAAGAPVVVVACDLPWLSPAVVRTLVDEASRPGGHAHAVVAQTDRQEPLCALWWPSAGSVVAAAFREGERSVSRMLDQLDLRRCAVAPEALVNVNTPHDLDRVRHSNCGVPPTAEGGPDVGDGSTPAAGGSVPT